ncbi:MAG: hemolysin family protein [Treponema sp.]|jgi:CBS domain containing-hemolysin-like protein|nr:hemolysin family protein [Treponema sp.]
MDNPNSILALTASLAVLLCLSAFFSACEMAYSSLNRIKLKNLAVHSKRAALALKLLDVYDKILSTALIGNNIVNIVASALATLLFVSLFGAKGVSLSALIVTVLVLVFGDISPKTLAKESPEQCALSFAPLLRFFVVIFTPLNYLAAAWKKLIVKIFPPKLDRSITEDELLTFVEEVRQEGGINKQEEQMIRHAIEFDEITASEIFTPRIDVAAISQTAAVEEIDSKFAETGFSRLPVFKDTIDNITGVILLKDFYHHVMNRRKAPPEIIKPVVFVTKTMKIAKLLRTLQQKQSHLAVVVDEFGGTLGIVTVEDIVEELVGEIWDEHDEVVQPVKKINDNSFVVMGSVNFKDMLEYITAGGNAGNGEDIPETTVGNWIMEKLGGLPRCGDEFFWGSLKIRVSGILRQRVMEVIVSVDAGVEYGKE